MRNGLDNIWQDFSIIRDNNKEIKNMAKFNKNWIKQLSESYIWEMQQFPPEIPPGQPSPQPAPQPAPPFIPPMTPPERPRPLPDPAPVPPIRPRPRMGQWRDPNPRNPRKPGRGGRTTGAERGPRNPPLLPPPPNINWANLWRQYSGSGYNNEVLQGLYLQAQRAGYYGSFGEFYATLFAKYGK